MGFMDNFTSDSPVTVKQPDYYAKDIYNDWFESEKEAQEYVEQTRIA